MEISQMETIWLWVVSPEPGNLHFGLISLDPS